MNLRELLSVTIIGAGATVFATFALAHHSVTGVFDGTDCFELTGTITEIEWVNPHVFVHLEVENDDGARTRWELETAPTSMFRNGGITKAMLQGDGQPVTITGIRALDKSLEFGWIHRITYADGHFYDISKSGL